MPRTTDRENFLRKLKLLAPTGATTKARHIVALGWEKKEAKYDAIKAKLLAESPPLICKVPGPGFNVALVAPVVEPPPPVVDAPPPPPVAARPSGIKVFISYCHADEQDKKDLVRHLDPLKRMGLIEEWHDRLIQAGDDLDRVIRENLEAAEIVLILVSVDFINSEYCANVELPQAWARRESNGTRVIPIILRPCMWKPVITPNANLMALPTDAKAVSLWAHRDQAFLNIAEGILTVGRGMRPTVLGPS